MILATDFHEDVAITMTEHRVTDKFLNLLVCFAFAHAEIGEIVEKSA